LSSKPFCLSDTLKHVEIERPQKHGALEVFPLRWPVVSHLDYMTLDEALEARSIEITEFTEGGRVSLVNIVNRSERMVFLMAGEHLVGCKQNRVVNSSVMIPPDSQIPLPVTCVERGRWGYRTQTFSSGHSSSHYVLRAMMACGAADCDRGVGGPKANQAAVWREVSRKMRAMASRSPSDALQAIFLDHDARLIEWAERFPVPTDCNGAVFVVGGIIAGADLFGSKETLRKLWPKLLRSCAIDALESPEQDRESTAAEEIANWLARGVDVGQQAFPSPGIGLDVRIHGKEITGASLVVNNQPVHAELFQPTKLTREPAGADPADAGHWQTAANTGPRAANGREKRPSFEPSSARENRMPMQFCSFDGSYLERLRSGDVQTQQHFVSYFSELIRLKLRRRLSSPSAIGDVRQETFTRVWVALRNERGIRQPESLGAFVNSVCNNVLREHYRRASKEVPSADEAEANVPDPATGPVDVIANGQMRQKVRQILDQLSERDCLLLEQVFLEERNKNQVCRDLGVSREYLRVLLHRAKKSFRALSLGVTLTT
jgi:RNA polymerase sigma-70 factor (ECF subfamily)